jgi:hypothetical protein
MVCRHLIELFRAPALGRTGSIYAFASPSPPAALDAAGEALLKEVSDRLGKRPLLLPMPFTLWHAMARIAEWLPAAPLSRNKVELMEMDSTASAAMPWSRGPCIGPVSIEHMLGQILEGG